MLSAQYCTCRRVAEIRISRISTATAAIHFCRILTFPIKSGTPHAISIKSPIKGTYAHRSAIAGQGPICVNPITGSRVPRNQSHPVIKYRFAVIKKNINVNPARIKSAPAVCHRGSLSGYGYYTDRFAGKTSFPIYFTYATGAFAILSFMGMCSVDVTTSWLSI